MATPHRTSYSASATIAHLMHAAGHTDGDHSRYIGPEYARMVKDPGGIIGAWITEL